MENEDEIKKQIERVEHQCDKRYERYLDSEIRYNGVIEQRGQALKTLSESAIQNDKDHARITKTLGEHIKNVNEQTIKIEHHMNTTNEILKHVTTKEDTEKLRSKVTTIWIIGGFLVMLLVGITVTAIQDVREDIRQHNEKVSNQTK